VSMRASPATSRAMMPRMARPIDVATIYASTRSVRWTVTGVFFATGQE
jgi:hypothetical protein